MALKTFRPAQLQWRAITDISMKVIAASDLDEREIVVPYNTASWVVDEYRILNGWPTEIPDHDVVAQGFVSSAGEIMSIRPGPGQISTGADVRWIASADSWDNTTFTWRPEDTAIYPQYVWQSSSDYAPTYLNDYTYRVGKEIVTRDALNFQNDAKEHLWSDFTGGSAGAVRFSVVMVVNFSAKFGIDASATQVSDYGGIFCAGHPTPSSPPNTFAEVVTGGTVDVHLRGRYLYARPAQQAFEQLQSIHDLLVLSQPLYLGITVDPPYLTVTSGRNAAKLTVGQTLIPSEETNNFDWVLGRATGDVLHGTDMTLFDCSFYGAPLSNGDMVGEIAALSACYGG